MGWRTRMFEKHTDSSLSGGIMRTVFACAMIIALTALSAPTTSAGAPTCTVHSGTPYCSYTGRVARVYVNQFNTILLYFDTPLDLSLPAAVGYDGVTSSVAGAISLTENPEWAKAAYATMLAANARGATVAVQMRGRIGGYAKIDRIWLYE